MSVKLVREEDIEELEHLLAKLCDFKNRLSVDDTLRTATLVEEAEKAIKFLSSLIQKSKAKMDVYY